MTDQRTLTWLSGTTGKAHLFKPEKWDMRRSVCGNSTLRKDRPKTRAQGRPFALHDRCKSCVEYADKATVKALKAALNAPPTKMRYDASGKPSEAWAKAWEAVGKGEPIDSVTVEMMKDELPTPREPWVHKYRRQNHNLAAGIRSAVVAKHAQQMEAERDALLQLLLSGKPGLGNRIWLIDIRPVRHLLNGSLYVEVVSTSGACVPTLTTEGQDET